MKKKLTIALAALALMPSVVFSQQYAEKLNRGAVSSYNLRSGVFVSWRSFADDPDGLGFNVYRGTKLLNSTPITTSTNYKDSSGTSSSVYTIEAVLDGEVVETFEATQWSSAKQLSLNRPDAGTTPANEEYTYSPNDCSVGDVNGDGSYEIILKWDPSNSKDNSQDGYTGNVYLDCYTLAGEQLWRIDLGPNIRAGAHYTQFMVYDFDGDGRAEMICKTAPGSIDGTGAYVNQAATEPEIQAADNSKDWRSSTGRVNGGQEWLTVFDGETGKAIHTVYYNPNRNCGLGGDAAGTFNWGAGSKNDTGSYGNRGERYLAAVAYLDGLDALPSAVFTRGYYTYAYFWAVDFDGEHLSTRWLHASTSTTTYSVTDRDGNKTTYTPGSPTGGTHSRTAYACGNHNLSVADVDGDGCDEIIWGACAINNDGTLLYSTGYGHGDAIHVGKMIPGREGLQVYDVHEESPYGWDLHDAATGEILYSATADGDTGRGIAADIDPDTEGWEMWCSADGYPRSAESGKKVLSVTPSQNFRIYWDGDLYDELLDGNTITKYSGGAMTTLSTLTGTACNGTKNTPCLSADILGDWREEVILYDATTCSDIYIFSTTTVTTNKLPCLMQDHQYRMSICWQNVAYNQPPHLGYYLPDGYAYPSAGLTAIGADRSADDAPIYNLQGLRMNPEHLSPGVYIQSGKKLIIH